MLETAWTSIPEVDIVLFVVQPTSKGINEADKQILEKLKKIKKKVILVINKIDLIKKEEILKQIALYNNEYDFEAVVPISAMKNENLELLLQEIEKNLHEGPAYYDIEEYTDQTERQIVEETIREHCFY